MSVCRLPPILYELHVAHCCFLAAAALVQNLALFIRALELHPTVESLHPHQLVNALAFIILITMQAQLQSCRFLPFINSMSTTLVPHLWEICVKL